MKDIIKWSIATLVLGFANLTWADGGDGTYLGVQIGQSNSNNGNGTVSNGSTTMTGSATTTGLAGRIFVGYNINKYAAVETGYARYANTTYDVAVSSSGRTAVRQSSWDFFGKGIFPIGSFGLFAKGGLAVVRVSPSGSLISPTFKSTYVEPAAGLGVSYAFTPNWVIDLSVTRIFGSDALKNIDFLALGVSYNFVNVYCGQFLC